MPKKLELVGQKFSKLTVIKEGPKTKKGESQWYCNCECGNKNILIRGYYLKNGHTSSCGCNKKKYFKERTEMINQKYGLLTILNEDDEVYCLCKCDCGVIKQIRRRDILSGNTRSCGCITSRGEYTIGQILLTNNISFKTQYSFPDLRGEKNHLYRFDFAIFDDNDNLSHLIEYDGRQHFFTEDNNSWDTKENFEKTQLRDKEKTKYCKDHNITLIRIPYTKLESLTLKDLLKPVEDL